jgi:carbonic anhydrase
MRLVEAIVNANHRALAGDPTAGLRPSDHAASLPVVALSCLDARLNPILPEVLGIPEEQFLWVRNAGNVVAGPFSDVVRSLALACLAEGAREILILGHTDCRVAQQTVMGLLERLASWGIPRDRLPDDLQACFGLFGSETQNLHLACEVVRLSPLISPQVPVHGLMVDLDTGRLDWLVNGYETLPALEQRLQQVVTAARQTVEAFRGLSDFRIGSVELKETPIGQKLEQAAGWLTEKLHIAEQVFQTSADSAPAAPGQGKEPHRPPSPPPVPPRIPSLKLRKP